MLKSKLLLRAAIAATAFAAAPQAQAVTFVLNSLNAGTAQGTQARQGFEIAARYWSSVLLDNATINLNIGFSTLGTGILGSTGSTRSLLSMQQYYTASALDASTALDAQAVAGLRPLSAPIYNFAPGASGAVTAIGNGFFNGVDGSAGYTDTATRIDNDGSINNATLAVTKASAKALGLTTDVNGNAINYASADGSIQFSDAFAFDFDPTDGIEANSFDFIGVAIHEIGHALGFVSGVDSVDANTKPGSTTGSSLEGFVVMSQLDLYRYSSAGNLDWSTQNVPYFSLNGGVSQLYGLDTRFSTGVANGDGRQASHWKDSPAGAPQIGILDPTSARGQLQEVTGLDLAAYDVIGYNVTQGGAGYRVSTADIYRQFAGANGAVPEPATWAMMIAGFGVVGASMRRRRTSVAFAA